MSDPEIDRLLTGCQIIESIVGGCLHDGSDGVCEDCAAAAIVIQREREREIAAVPKGEGLANARLIAAAPDLLEALKSVSVFLQFNDPRADGMRAEINRAIARAEGK